MKEYQRQIQQWWHEGKRVTLARVIQTWGSSPRPVGSCMFISSEGEMLGSVSGGCVEGAVVKEAKLVLESGQAKRLHYGVSDDDAWAVGLSCGGKLDVFIQPWNDDHIVRELTYRLENNEGCTLVTKLSDGNTTNVLFFDLRGQGADIPDKFELKVRESYLQRTTRTITQSDGDYFTQIFPPRSKMLIIGAAHITTDLVKLAHEFDFETIVIDPRKTFAEKTLFSIQPDQIFQAFPSEVFHDLKLDAYTYAVILSHDPKIDDDALKILLRSDVAYIGALGSTRNHEKRAKRLQEAGFSETEIAKINAPIGVDINAQGAKEIALSIMGAVVKAKNEFYRKDAKTQRNSAT
jgi:xanthine dehydrogenase accessory factor